MDPKEIDLEVMDLINLAKVPASGRFLEIE